MLLNNWQYLLCVFKDIFAVNMAARNCKVRVNHLQ